MGKNKRLFEILKETEKESPVKRDPEKLYSYTLVRGRPLNVLNEKANVPQIAARMIRDYINIQQENLGHDKEIMALILLSAEGFPINSPVTVAVGNEDALFLRPQDVFKHVLSTLVNARGFILGHNHTNGALQFSPEDEQAIQYYKTRGLEFDKPLCDFIVVSDLDDGYISAVNRTYKLAISETD